MFYLAIENNPGNIIYFLNIFGSDTDSAGGTFFLITYVKNSILQSIIN